ncbi:hypothetical protein [Nostoc sp.]|uniref:hypothetical protein n=1 Tax=Nostoc sp. TaxID=1180 RepID=UPI002FF77180
MEKFGQKALVPQGGSQKSKGASALGGFADLKQLAFKSQKYYGISFLGILNGRSIYAVAYYPVWWLWVWKQCRIW